MPLAEKFDVAKHTGIKGIQGFKNSAYVDATLYGMFTFSDAFDALLFEEATTNAEELHLQRLLKSDIVYPLRKYVHKILFAVYIHMYVYIAMYMILLLWNRVVNKLLLT